MQPVINNHQTSSQPAHFITVSLLIIAYFYATSPKGLWFKKVFQQKTSHKTTFTRQSITIHAHRPCDILSSWTLLSRRKVQLSRCWRFKSSLGPSGLFLSLCKRLRSSKQRNWISFSLRKFYSKFDSEETWRSIYSQYILHSSKYLQTPFLCDDIDLCSVTDSNTHSFLQWEQNLQQLVDRTKPNSCMMWVRLDYIHLLEKVNWT